MMPAWFQLTDVAAADSAPRVALDIFARSSLVLVLGGLGALLLRRGSASARHFLWCLAIVGSLLVPMFARLLPSWRVPVFPAVPASASAPAAPTFSAPRVAAPLTVTRQAPPEAVRSPAETRTASEIASNLPPTVGELSATPRQVSTASADSIVVRPTRSLSAGAIAFALWLGGVLVVLARVLAGQWRLRAIAQRARPLVDHRWLSLVERARVELGITRPMTVLESDADTMPMTWGVMRPVLLLPAGSGAWNVEQRLDVVRHELAHVRRRDCLTQLLARLACAVYWPNPLIWLATSRLHVERERACDDEVVRAGTRASSYAERLLGIASTMRTTPREAFAALAMARRSQLADRLRALLDERRSHGRVSTGLARAAVGVSVAIVPMLAILTPVARLEARATPPAPRAAPTRSSDAGVPSARARVVERTGRATVLAPVTNVASTAAASGAAVEVADSIDADARPTVGVSVVDMTPPTLVRPASMPDVLFADGRSMFDRALAALTPSPAPPQQGAACAQTRKSSLSIQSDGSRQKNWRLRWQADDCEMRAEARGTVVLRGDLSDVDRISDGGSFELEREVGDDHRRIVIESRDGRLERTYYIGRREHAYDDAAKAWFATALLEMERRTAIAADQRVPALLAQGGVQAVLRETEQLMGDYARRKYFSVLLDRKTLNAGEVRQVVEQAGTTIGSDYELAELLVQVAGLEAFNDESHRAFVTATRTIQSDYERRRALSALLAKPGLATATVNDLLMSAKEIHSDYELAELLIAVSRRYAVDERTRPIYIDAVANIKSDYEHRRVLGVIMQGGNLSPATTKALLEDATGIGSDYERAEFLVGVVKAGAIDESNRADYFAAVNGIKSDYEHHRVLTAFLKRETLKRDDVKGVLQSARRISSDYECASLLVEVAKNYAFDKDLRDLYLDAAATLGSEYERNRALAAMALVKTI